MGQFRYILLSVVLLLGYVNLYSYPNYSFKHYNINNGLSQNTVRCILQDKTGFMWFGTKDGLSRFDGTAFKIFKFSPGGDLSNNVFHHILEDKNGNIWVATEGGIYIYNPLMEKFERFRVVTGNNESIDGWISDLVSDSEGDIWISVEEKGVFHYNFETKDLILYPVKTVPGGMRMINLCVGKNNDIWVFPYGLPLMRIDKESQQTSEFQIKDDPDFFSGLGEIRNAISDENNQLIVPTSNKGLISINTINKTYRILLDTDSSGEPVFARTVKRIDSQTFWVGTESGVYILNTLEGTVVNLRHDNLITTSLSDNAIYSIYQDREGGIWVGSYFGGVDYYSEQLNKFEVFYPIPQINDMKGSRVREFFPADDE
uniref:ligand-binding sensor domain-containing protein n=1 Tax=Proteiniphilum sp. UBA5384 TaxID=1947279 RepID=UPI0025E1946B